MEQRHYFEMLPNEILIKIFQFVNTADLLKVCGVFNLYYLFQDKDVVKKVNLYKCYEMKDLKSLSKLITFDYVHTLNINGLYWIKPVVLRSFVQKMTNLKRLFAVSTSLSLEPEDLILYNKCNIEKLAITVLNYHIDNTQKVLSVKSLYLQLKRTNVFINAIFPNVESLWVDIEKPIPNIKFCYSPDFTLTKILMKSNFVNLNSYEMIYPELSNIYKFVRPSQPTVKYWEKRPKPPNLDLSDSPSWQVLESLHNDVAWSLQDNLKLLQRKTLKDFYWSELFLKHSRISCIPKFLNSSKEILSSSEVIYLKKLAINVCVLSCDICQNSSKQETFGFKRKRVGLKQSCEHVTKHFLYKLKCLQLLEIGYCDNWFHESCVSIYPLIAELSELHTLVLEIPVYNDGKFLIDTLKNCKKLETLRINSEHVKDTLIFNISLGLPFAESLENFGLNIAGTMPLEKILKALVTLETQKLRRLMFICDSIDKDKNNELFSSLNNLISKNPNLIFFGLKVKNYLPNSVHRSINSLFQQHKKDHPGRCFYVHKESLSYIGNDTLPDIHNSEMVLAESAVAVPNPYKDFEDF